MVLLLIVMFRLDPMDLMILKQMVLLILYQLCMVMRKDGFQLEKEINIPKEEIFKLYQEKK